MIIVKTVFVLGAGASQSFEYPLGKDLKTQIIQSLESEQGTEFQQLINMGFLTDDIWSFKNSLNFSGMSTIDAFLEHRSEYENIGKATIAQHLIKWENPNKLFYPTNDNWCEYIFGKMKSTFENFDKNNVSFVTFNYDRTLEYYLHTALTNSYNKKAEATIRAVNRLPIIHVHGVLGQLPWQSKDGRSYPSTNEVQEIRRASQGIKIVTDQSLDSNTPEFTSAQSLIRDADRIIFLGFGYDSTNLERLGIPTLVQGKTVIGSAFGLTPLEIIDLQLKYPPLLCGPPYQRVLDFLKSTVRL